MKLNLTLFRKRYASFLGKDEKSWFAENAKNGLVGDLVMHLGRRQQNISKGVASLAKVILASLIVICKTSSVSK